MNVENNQRPCLVETEQGLFVTYKGKFLYSKYNPSKSILQKIDSMEILPGTVILAMSPVLCYGLKELIAKLPEDCAVLLCEEDEELCEVARPVLSGWREKEDEKYFDSFSFLIPSERYNLPVILQKTNHTFEDGYKLKRAGTYRRVVRIDFSAGVQFHADFYDTLESACVNAVKQFWTNRITITKFGRRFSRNIFRNLKSLPESKSIADYIGKISKPIVVFGAGETSEDGMKKIKSEREKYFVLCADTAFPMLTGTGIVPDGIVLDEAQSVISESFIGAKDADSVQIFQSLCSLPHAAGKNFPLSRTCFYATEYAPSDFFENLKSQSFFPPVVPAFGSVGITAYFLANLFRSSPSVPVTVYGLDFAYSVGKTHAKGTPAHKRQLREKNRLKSDGNFAACFGANVIKIESGSANEKLNFSTPILRSYADTFEKLKVQIDSFADDYKNYLPYQDSSEKISSDIEKYLLGEQKSLEELRDILTGKKSLSDDERDKRIFEISSKREYLYLHFPDGYCFKGDLSFLKRIRSEIDFFLKYI